MAHNKFRLLYMDKSLLHPSDVCKLTQASIVFADECLVRASATPDPSLSEEDFAFVSNRLEFLRSMGGVKLWAIEGENEIADTVGLEPLGHPDYVVDLKTYQESHRLVTNRVKHHRDLFLKHKSGHEIDGVTELVMGRNQLWKLAMSAALDADRVLAEEPSVYAMKQYFSSPLLRYSVTEKPILEQVFKKLGVANISLLPEDEIRRCRKYLPSFRNDFLNRTKNFDSLLFTEGLVERIANEITNEYMDQLEEMAKCISPGRAITREIFWDIITNSFKPAIIAKYARMLFSWGEGQNKRKSLQFMFSLRQGTRDLGGK